MWGREKIIYLKTGLADGGEGVIHSTRRERAVDRGGAQGVFSPAEAGRVLGQRHLQGRDVHGGTCVLSEMKKKTSVTLSVLVLHKEREMSPERGGCLSLTTVNTREEHRVLEAGTGSIR